MAWVLVLGGAYAVMARGGLALYAVRGFAALVWPPTGLALAALLLYGRWLWPGIFAGAFLVNHWAGASIPVSLGIAAGNTAEAVLAHAALTKVGFRPTLSRARDVVALVLAAMATSLVSASVGVGSLRLGGNIPADDSFQPFQAWWVGDLLGALVVAPLLLTWFTPQSQPRGEKRRLEAAALLAIGSSLAAFVFVTAPAAFRQPFLVFPILVWAALRFGQRAGATATAGLSALAVAATLSGLGPFAGPHLHDSLVALQVFVGAIALGTLALGAVVVERAQVERALDQNHTLLRAVAEGTSDAVFAKDQDGRYLLINQAGAGFVGQPIEDILGRLDETLFPPDSAAKIRELDLSVMAGGEPRTLEESLDTARGAVTFSSMKAPLRDREGRVVGLVGIARDITVRKQTEAQLRQAIAVRDEFMSIASHELRTPLSVLILELASLDRLFRSADLGAHAERTREKTARATRQAHRLTRLIERLLEVSRIESGRLELEREELDLAALAQEVSEQFREEAVKAGSPIELRAPAPVPGRWDPLRLEQVLGNLLSNALKFGPGKPVQVEVVVQGDQARLTVRDQGLGLGAADRRRIFDRFERAVPARHFGGLGLGLYIARQLVEAHGGTIRADDTPGGGATFEVILPRRPLADPPAEAGPPPAR